MTTVIEHITPINIRSWFHALSKKNSSTAMYARKLVTVTRSTASATPHSNFRMNIIRKATSMSMNQTSWFLLYLCSSSSSNDWSPVAPVPPVGVVSSSPKAEAWPTGTNNIARHAIIKITPIFAPIRISILLLLAILLLKIKRKKRVSGALGSLDR